MKKTLFLFFMFFSLVVFPNFKYGEYFQEITFFDNGLSKIIIPDNKAEYTICIFAHNYKRFDNLTKKMFINLRKQNKSYKVVIFTNNQIIDNKIISFTKKHNITLIPKQFNEEIQNNYLYSNICPRCMALLIIRNHQIYFFDKSFELSLLNSIVKEF